MGKSMSEYHQFLMVSSLIPNFLLLFKESVLIIPDF